MTLRGSRPGELKKAIRVTTNDPAHKTDTLICQSRVLTACNFNPSSVNFGEIKRDDAAITKTIKLTQGDAGPLALEVKKVGMPNVQTNLREIKPGEVYELDVTAAPPWPNDRFRGQLRLATGVEASPEIAIPIFGNIAPRVVAIPSRLTLATASEEDVEQTIRLDWKDTEPHNITGATVTDPTLTVRVDNTDAGQQVVLVVPANAERRARTSTVTIQTDDKEAPTVRVPVYFRAKNAPGQATRNLRQATPGRRPAQTARTRDPAQPQGLRAAPKAPAAPAATEPPQSTEENTTEDNKTEETTTEQSTAPAPTPSRVPPE